MKRQKRQARPRRRGGYRPKRHWVNLMPTMRRRRLDRQGKQGKERMKAMKRTYRKRQRTLGPWGLGGLAACLLLFLLAAVATEPVSSSNPNPTAVVIDLTPSPTATPESAATATPLPDSLYPPDRFAPNHTPETAAEIGLGHQSDLTLTGDNPDWFRLYLKAGQIVQIETAVYGQTDTQLSLYWGDQQLAYNDDRSPTDVGSEIIAAVPADGWYYIRIRKAAPADGRYDLTVSLAAPTATPTATSTSTPSPTPTASPTGSPTPTVTPTTPTQGAFGPPPPIGPPPPGPAAPVMPQASPTATVSPTDTLTTTVATTGGISLTLTYLGQVQPTVETPITGIRLLVYYDANNDRQPGPGEGVANVSVLAVNNQGQPIARVFTNAQGEAVFNLTSDNVARVIVPFVPGWSARVRIGDRNNEIVLGLPAVRLPVFLPVASRSEGASSE